MKKICVVTSTRADYGLLKPVVDKLNTKPDIEVLLVVTGTHLSKSHGMTVNAIEEDGLNISARIEILDESEADSAYTQDCIMARTIMKFGKYFEDKKPDALLVLGDRFEILAVCISALNSNIPIIHMHGGETTEGALDEMMRHAITKMSYLHFTSLEEYRQRVIHMGEEPDRVFSVGATGVENCLNTELLSEADLSSQLIELCKYKTIDDSHKNKVSEKIKNHQIAVLTFHPVTLENNTAEEQIEELLSAISDVKDILFIATMANADNGGRVINEKLRTYTANSDNLLLYESLGMKRYLSAVSMSAFVIGNSSSGIIEVPSFHVPVINIGDRQKGRVQSNCIINCEPQKSEIISAINKTTSKEFIRLAKEAGNPYGDGKTSEKIANIICEYLTQNKLELKKQFFDVK